MPLPLCILLEYTKVAVEVVPKLERRYSDTGENVAFGPILGTLLCESFTCKIFKMCQVMQADTILIFFLSRHDYAFGVCRLKIA
jgi:hypothetical protein